MNPRICFIFILDLLILNICVLPGDSRKHRSVVYNEHILDMHGNQVDHQPGSSMDLVWYTQTVAAGDTAVLHCSFDAIFSQLRNGNIDWTREKTNKDTEAAPIQIAVGKKVMIDDRRYRVYRPHNSALSVLIIRRAKKRDAGIYRCNLSGSSTRHKFMALNVTESTIEAKTSPPRVKTHIGNDVTLWCNASGYPQPVVYWTREDRNRKLQDGTYQYWGSGLQLRRPTADDTGIYACYLDNFVQPVVSYTFNMEVEDNPWSVDGYKMRFDSTQWYPASNPEPVPVRGMSYLLMCETRGAPKPLPKMRWLRDGKPITNTKHFYIIEDRPDWRTGYISSTLVIMRFVPRFQANYTCVGVNVFREKAQSFMVHSYIEKLPSTKGPDASHGVTKSPTSLSNILEQPHHRNGIDIRYGDVFEETETESKVEDDEDVDTADSGSAMGDDTDDTENDDVGDEVDGVISDVTQGDTSKDGEGHW